MRRPNPSLHPLKDKLMIEPKARRWKPEADKQKKKVLILSVWAVKDSAAVPKVRLPLALIDAAFRRASALERLVSEATRRKWMIDERAGISNMRTSI